jgi:SAM-dependent methyltransferase
MDQQARARLTQLYRRSLGLHGPTARGLRWSSEEGQRERFRLLAEIGSWERRSVADIGCGVGDLLGFLRGEGWRGRVYDGFDIVPEMVEHARVKQRGRGGRFEVRDVLAEGFPRHYDYVVASGTFNLRTEGHDLFFRQMIEAMYAACRRGVAFNVLQPLPHEGSPDKAYDVLYQDSYYDVSPPELLILGQSLGAWVELVFAESLPDETTVLLRRPW